MFLSIPLMVLSMVVLPSQRPVVASEGELNVIPLPRLFQRAPGHFQINANARLELMSEDAEVERVSRFLQQYVLDATGFRLPLNIGQKAGRPEPGISLHLTPEDSGLGTEGYRLRITQKQVLLSAPQPAGLFYGLQTLRQLLPAKGSRGEAALPCVDIEDAPRFPWRGAMLDVGRHFFDKSFVKRFIDHLAMNKLNTFHWHLTEDQGWRVQIDRYPRLTSVGAWRADRGEVHWNEREPQGEAEPATYGGFYTKDDLREVVAYAQQRFVKVIPEIEMPGHAVAALAAYPELSCTGGPYKVMTGGYWPISDIYCAGNDQTFEFLENVLDEVIPLFPAEYVHIGGDEAFKENWRNCAKCQARMQQDKLQDEHALQSYFIRRIEVFLNARGKKLIGWDEILEGGLAPNATVMSWRGTEGGIAAASAGHDVVMSPTTHAYFDYYQARFGEPVAIGGYLPLDSVYAFEPLAKAIPSDRIHHVLGAQANLWTEYIPTPEHAEYMLFPRLAAMAEVVWTPSALRNFADFSRRLQHYFAFLTKEGINFRVPPPADLPPQLIDSHGVRVIFDPAAGSEIRYTLDGSDVGPGSTLYKAPFTVQKNAVLKARRFLAGGRQSRVLQTEISIVDPESSGLHFALFPGQWDELPEFDRLTPAKVGIAYVPSLEVLPAPDSAYAVRFSGYLRIETSGNYRFFLTSADGARLRIGDDFLIDNDGQHATTTRDGEVLLEAGTHALNLEYFHVGWVKTLQLEYAGPGVLRRPLPARLLFREEN